MTNLTETKPSIQVIRNQRVMLSTELAHLYGVSPSVLMQAVKRNLLRFAPDFMFQLKSDKWADLKSQIVTSSLKNDLGSLKSQFVISNKAVFNAIRALMQSPKPKKHPIGFTAEIKTKEIKI